MTIATLSSPRERFSLLSDQFYREPRGRRRYTAAPIAMDASQPFRIAFGSQGYFQIDREPPKWFIPLLARVCELGELQPDWNSYGANAVDPYTASTAATLLLEILTERDPTPAIVPTARGGMLIEWHDYGVDLEVDVRSPTSIHVAYQDQNHDEEVCSADFQAVVEKLNLLRSHY